MRRSVLTLAAAGVAVGVMSEILVGSLEDAAEGLGLSPFFIGLIVVAIVGNAAEHWVALYFAKKDKMDLTVNIAIGSGAQIALFVAPVLVLASLFLGPEPMALVFNGYELAAILIAILAGRPGRPRRRVDLVRGLPAPRALRDLRGRVLLRLIAASRPVRRSAGRGSARARLPRPAWAGPGGPAARGGERRGAAPHRPTRARGATTASAAPCRPGARRTAAAREPLRSLALQQRPQLGLISRRGQRLGRRGAPARIGAETISADLAPRIGAAQQEEPDEDGGDEHHDDDHPERSHVHQYRRRQRPPFQRFVRAGGYGEEVQGRNASSGRASVLVVDDEPTISEVVARYLVRAGYETRIAGDGAQALALHQERPADLIVLDVMMPSLSGVEVLRRCAATAAMVLR